MFCDDSDACDWCKTNTDQDCHNKWIIYSCKSGFGKCFFNTEELAMKQKWNKDVEHAYWPHKIEGWVYFDTDTDTWEDGLDDTRLFLAGQKPDPSLSLYR